MFLALDKTSLTLYIIEILRLTREKNDLILVQFLAKKLAIYSECTLAYSLNSTQPRPQGICLIYLSIEWFFLPDSKSVWSF